MGNYWSNYLVSVIVPVYNSEEFLDKCIQSIINQSYKDIELILVNDGSLDSSGDICDRYALMDNRIKVIHKTNSGLVHTRKTGLRASSGEYILYVDGDDWIELNLIEDYIAQVIRYNVDIVIAPHIVNLEGREDVLINTIPAGIYYKPDLISSIFSKMLYTGKFSQFGIFSYSWGKLYWRGSLLDNQLKVDENITIGEDALCVYPTLLDAYSIAILDRPYYHYRQRTDSLIKSLKSIDIKHMNKVYSDFKQIFIDRNMLDIMLPQLQYYILSLLIINTTGPEIKENNELYPFGIIHPKNKIIIYGGGTFGQHLYKQILNNKIYNVVAWVDEKYEHYSRLNLPVISISEIKNIEYDIIILALIDEENSNQAMLKLINHNVAKDKIIQLPYYSKTEPIQKILTKFKINL